MSFSSSAAILAAARSLVRGHSPHCLEPGHCSLLHSSFSSSSSSLSSSLAFFLPSDAPSDGTRRAHLRLRSAEQILLSPGGYVAPSFGVGVGVGFGYGGSDGVGIGAGHASVAVRSFGRKAARMGHHLETLEEMAHRDSRADAREKRKKKKNKGRKGGKGSEQDDEDDKEEEADELLSFSSSHFASGAAAAIDDASSGFENEEDLSETKFHHGAGGDDDAPLPEPSDVRSRMMKVVAAMEESFKAIRGAEPTPELFESISVDVYGSRAPLSSVAQVVIVGPNRATLSCYDPGTASAVRDAVRDSGLGFNPSVEEGGGTVVVPIPKVSSETRERLSRRIGKAAEAGRQRVRRIRRAAQDVVKLGKEGKLAGVGEDEAFRAGKDIDAVTEEVITKLNEVVEKKQDSIMAV